MRDFEKRHVVVTGGSGALGTAVVTALIERGAHVHVPVFVPKELDRFPYRDHEQVSVRLGLDFTVEETVAKYYADLPSCWASIHVAGGFRMAAFTDTSLEDFLFLMNMNAVTCFLSSREAVRKMRAGGAGGRIVNVTAKPALVPTGGLVAYAASKAVVAALTTSLAEEVAPDGIWVNAIAPSIIDTSANRRSMPKADHAAWPKPEELAATIVHLASPSNAVGRGAIVPVYGRS
ncbi:MAG: SDR family NAD(P)-dependent oxidoreductase [Sandaracinaceae bacterium]|nr:SDR family NAD(P)-dependent oxidoreductase [Sandaracinaceae bacterium]